MKKITIIGINYFPEDSAIGLYTTQKAEYLVSKGFDVTVITGFPYYPKWEISKEYKNKGFFLRESINGVKVIRCKQYVPKVPTFSKRIIHLLSFSFGNFINLFKTKKPDFVIAIIPFTTSAMLGWFLKLRYRTKLWVHIQDFEFDAAIDSGLLDGKKKSIVSVLQRVEKWVLNKANIASTISYGMLDKLKTKTTSETYYLTNWIDLNQFSSENHLAHKYLQSNKFKILYSGNIGAKQDWNFFLEFLEALNNPLDIEVVVVGDGAEKDWLISHIKKYSFVQHYGLVPYSELSSLLSSADLHVLFQKNDVIDTVMPSKLLGMMASSKPSIVTGNSQSEVNTVMNVSNSGYYFSLPDALTIANKISELKSNLELCNKLGINGKNYVTKYYSKDVVLNNFVNKLNSI